MLGLEYFATWHSIIQYWILYCMMFTCIYHPPTTKRLRTETTNTNKRAPIIGQHRASRYMSAPLSTYTCCVSTSTSHLHLLMFVSVPLPCFYLRTYVCVLLPNFRRTWPISTWRRSAVTLRRRVASSRWMMLSRPWAIKTRKTKRRWRRSFSCSCDENCHWQVRILFFGKKDWIFSQFWVELFRLRTCSAVCEHSSCILHVPASASPIDKAIVLHAAQCPVATALLSEIDLRFKICCWMCMIHSMYYACILKRGCWFRRTNHSHKYSIHTT